MNKIIAINKPVGPTSNQALTQIKIITGERKVGHAGTLDPLAEGVLIVGIGREATKKLSEAAQKEKEYAAKIKFGEASSTDDEEGEKTITNCKSPITIGAIKKILPKFKGVIKQTPPVYSAIKIQGKEAYKRARQGEKIKMAAREATIKEIEILKYQWPYLELRIVTGPGVYIRALARDIGRELGCGAYLAGLIRTRVGEYRVEDAIRADDLKKIFV